MTRFLFLEQCPDLKSPVNGRVNVAIKELWEATYECESGFTIPLNQSSSRLCNPTDSHSVNGTQFQAEEWTGSEPVCVGNGDFLSFLKYCYYLIFTF